MKIIGLSGASLLATAILAVQAVVYFAGSGKEVIPKMPPWSQFPPAVKDWQAITDIPVDQEVLDKLRPDDYLNRNYASGEQREILNFFVGYFSSRRNGRAPHSPEWCLPGAGWKSISTRTIFIPISNEAQPFPANEYLIEKGADKQFVLYWYHQGDRTVANDVVAQLYALPDLILHGRTDTALIRIIVPMHDGDTAAAKRVAVAFAQDVYPLIRKRILQG